MAAGDTNVGSEPFSGFSCKIVIWLLQYDSKKACIIHKDCYNAVKYL